MKKKKKSEAVFLKRYKKFINSISYFLFYITSPYIKK